VNFIISLIIDYRYKRDILDIIMKVFLSHSLPPYDSALPARLRAVALGYDVELLLPDVSERSFLAPNTRLKIAESQAVVAFAANYGTQLEAINLELQEAFRQGKPVIALVENYNLISNVPTNRVVVFDRLNPSYHEDKLFQVLNSTIAEQQGKKNLIAALAALGAVALGLYAFGELTKE
jgi:hypothetical protein